MSLNSVALSTRPCKPSADPAASNAFLYNLLAQFIPWPARFSHVSVSGNLSDTTCVYIVYGYTYIYRYTHIKICIHVCSMLVYEAPSRALHESTLCVAARTSTN